MPWGRSIVQGRVVKAGVSALQPTRLLIRTVRGILTDVSICFLGSRAKRNTTFPITEITKGNNGAGRGVSQRQETSQMPQQSSQNSHGSHHSGTCAGPGHSREWRPCLASLFIWLRGHSHPRTGLCCCSKSHSPTYCSPTTL